jgi:hypothetical protein
MTYIRSAPAALLVGVFVAAVLYFATSVTAPHTYLGSPCWSEWVYPGFDAWTGEPHGLSFTTSDCGATEPRMVNIALPDDMVGRTAVPLPVGFVIGTAAGLLLVGIRSRRRARGSGAFSNGSHGIASPG